MYNFGMSPYPQGVFQQLEPAFSNLGRAAEMWMQLRNQRTQAQTQLLQQMLSNPTLTDEQRQGIVGQIQSAWSKDPLMRGIHWPTTHVSTPAGAGYQGPGNVSPAAGTPPTFPSPEETPPGPGAFPTSGAPAVPESGPPKIAPPVQSTQFMLPYFDPMQRPISSQSPQMQEAIRKAVGDNLWSVIQGMPLGEALQRFPRAAFALQSGGMTGQTVGDFEPQLKGTRWGDQPLYSVMDPRTGQPNPAIIDSMLRAARIPTTYENILTEERRTSQQDRQNTVLHNGLAARIRQIVSVAKGRSPEQAHALMLQAHDLLSQFQKTHPDIDTSDIDVPDSQAIAGPTEGRPRAPAQPRSPGRGRAPGTPRTARPPAIPRPSVSSQAAQGLVNAKWRIAERSLPEPVRQAMYRYAHGQPAQPGDDKLLAQTLQYGGAPVSALQFVQSIMADDARAHATGVPAGPSAPAPAQQSAPSSSKPGTGKTVKLSDARRKYPNVPINILRQQLIDQGYTVVP